MVDPSVVTSEDNRTARERKIKFKEYQERIFRKNITASPPLSTTPAYLGLDATEDTRSLQIFVGGRIEFSGGGVA
eukprot:6890466-Pyramimonas_sp.AAC.2